MLALLTTILVLNAPTPAELLLQGEARGEFVAAWAPAYLVVDFEPPQSELASRDLRRRHQALAALVRAPDGTPAVLAPASRLRGGAKVRLRFRDGRDAPARVVPPPDHDHTPFVLLEPEDPAVLAGRLALAWAEPPKPEDGTRNVWALERVARPEARPILVHAQVLTPVEPPLGRFRYATVEAADGLALIDHEGKLRCLVFRAVPGVRQRSLCAPTWEAAVFGRPP